MMHRRDKLFLERRNIALYALVAISVFALLFSPVRSALTQGVYAVAPAVWGIGGSTANAWGAVLVNFKTKSALMQENESLTALVDHMQAQVLDRNLLAEKVTKLEESLGRAQSDDRVVADVLAGPGHSPYDTLVIDAGTEQGINVGNMVVYAGSGVVGEIVEANQSTAKVKLYSSPGEERSVVVGAHAVPVIALGRGMGNFEARVAQNSSVAVGDNVLSAKVNLIVGVVSLVEEKPAEPFKRIFFRVPFNIAEMRTVEVIIIKGNSR